MTRGYTHSAPSAEQLRDIFESRSIPEPNSGCHLWLGAVFTQRGGYGVFTCRPAEIYQERAHRRAWKIYRGEITEDDHVLHSCDNPICVNPDHLFLGDQPSNMADKVAKGRQNKGETHHFHKLIETEAVAILRSEGRRQDIADKFGVSLMTVYDIKSGRSWKHLHRDARH